MNNRLNNKKVAILVADGFEKDEFMQPREALEAAGAKVTVVAPKPGPVKSWSEGNWGPQVDVDLTVDKANAEDFDALLLPGGVINPDTLRQVPQAVDFTRAIFDAGKPIAAICHGPQLLIEAGVVARRKLTSFPSIKLDLMNAGANWVDAEVVTDQGLVTSRSPADIPAFNDKMIEEFAEGVHARQENAPAG